MSAVNISTSKNGSRCVTRQQSPANDAEASLAKLLEGLQIFERAIKRCCKQRRTGTFTAIVRVESGRVTVSRTKSDLIHLGDRSVNCEDLEESDEDIHV